MEIKTRKKFISLFVTMALCVIVFFCVTSFLIFPAVTMAKADMTLSCNFTPHTHTDTCFDKDKTLICGFSENYTHTHDENCFDENTGELVCKLKETPKHVHTDTCYETVTYLVCDKNENESHTHTDSCFKQKAELCCEHKNEHVHEKSCYDDNNNLICGKIEVANHEHTSDCFVRKEPLNAKRILKSVLNSNSIYTDEIDMLDQRMITGVNVFYKISGQNDWTQIENKSTDDDGTPSYSILTQMTKNDLIRFVLSYNVPANALSEKTKTGYDLPHGIKISAALSGSILNDSHQSIGTYQITPQNDNTNTPAHITLQFNDQTVALNRAGSIITGSVNIDSTIDALERGDDGKVDLEFSDEVSFGFEINDEHVKRGDISVAKVGYNKNDQNGTISYKITVSTIEGTFNNPVKIHDKMTNIIYDSTTNDFLVKDKNNNPVTGYYFYVTQNGEEVSLGTAMPQNADEFWLSLPALNPGEGYEITYTAKISDTTSFSNLQTKNAVTASTIASNGEQIESSVPGNNVTYTFGYASVTKSGTLNQANHTIDYQIDLNRFQRDLSGFTISDIYNEEQKVVTASITPAIEGQTQITLPYTFPENTTGHYILTYTIPATPQLGTSNAFNYVTLRKNQTAIKSNTVRINGITPTAFLPLAKTPMGIDDMGDGTLKVKWKIKLDISQDSIRPQTNTGTWFQYDGSANDMHNLIWYTKSQLVLVKNNFRAALDNAGLSNSFYMKLWPGGTVVHNDSDIPNNKTFHGFTFFVSGSISKGKVIEYTYEQTANKNEDQSVTYTNQAEISANGINEGDNKLTVHASQTYTAVKPRIEKFEADSSNTQKNSNSLNSYDIHRETLNENERIVRWIIKVNIPENYVTNRDLVLNETFPNGLELLDIKSAARCYDGMTGIKAQNQQQSHLNPGAKSVVIKEKNGNSHTVTFNTIITTTPDGRSNYQITIPKELVALMAKWPKKINTGLNTDMIDPYDNINQDASNLYNKRIIYFYVYARIPNGDEVTAWQKIDSFHRRGEFLNEVELLDKISSDDYSNLVPLGTANQTVRKTTEFDINLISKNHGAIENNVIPYNITINPNAKALSALGEKIQIVDELKVYDSNNIRPDLIGGKVDIFTDSAKTQPLSADKFQMTFETDNGTDNGGRFKIYRINLTVPDRQTLYLSYSYFINGQVNQACSMKNTVKIVGYSQNDNWKSEITGFHVQEAGAQGQVHQIFFRKVDASNYQFTLPNAKFELYSVDKNDTLGPLLNYTRVENQAVGTQGPEKYVFTSDQNGVCSLTIEKDHAYCILETEAPPGYLKDPKPHYFYIYGEHGEVSNLPQGVLAPDNATDSQIATTDPNVGEVEEGYDIFEVEKFDAQTNAYSYLNGSNDFNALDVGDKVKIRFSFNIPGKALSLNEQSPLQNAKNAAVCYVGRHNVTSYPYQITMTQDKTENIVIQGDEGKTVGLCTISKVTQNGSVFAKITSKFNNDVVKANMAGEDIPGSVFCEATIKKDANGANYVDFDNQTTWTCKTTKVNHPFHFYSANDNIHFDNINNLKLSKTWYKSTNPVEYLTESEIPFDEIKINIMAEISPEIVDTYDIVYDQNGNLLTRVLPINLDDIEPGENKNYKQTIAAVTLNKSNAVADMPYKWEKSFSNDDYLEDVAGYFYEINATEPDGLMQYGILKTTDPQKMKWNNKIVVLKYSFSEVTNENDRPKDENGNVLVTNPIGETFFDEDLRTMYRRVYGTVSVGNILGYELPETGGIGTTVFYCSGSVLILGAVIGILIKRRKTKKDP